MSKFVQSAAIFIGTSFLASTTAVGGESSAGDAKSAAIAWTPRVSVALRYFDSETVNYSPDGSHFFFVSHHDDLKTDSGVFELWVYNVGQVVTSLARRMSAPSPVMHFVRSASGNQYTGNVGHIRGAIVHPAWEKDGRSIAFKGLDDAGILQYYLIDIRSMSVRQLTHWTHEVLNMERRGQTIVANLYIPQARVDVDYRPHPITRAEIEEALTPGVSGERNLPDAWLRTFVVSGDSQPWEILSSDEEFKAPLWFASDGRKVIESRIPHSIPDAWRMYQGIGRAVGKAVDDGRGDFRQFVLIDAAHGTAKPVFDAPGGTAIGIRNPNRNPSDPTALWAEDNVHVVLVNTLLPISSSNTDEVKSTSYVVGLNTDNGKFSAIEPLLSRGTDGASMVKIRNVAWARTGRELLIEFESDGKATVSKLYTLVGDEWRVAKIGVNVAGSEPKSKSLLPDLSVHLEESLNSAPMMVTSRENYKLPLTPPDPALGAVRYTSEQLFEWQEAGGNRVAGGLLLPEGATGPVPLVIQVNDGELFDDRYFRPDGVLPQPYAAQSLVARGMAVLNMPIPGSDTPGIGSTSKEFPAMVERIDSAVDALASRGLVDRSRVGLLGFSHSGYATFGAITHPGKVVLSAALIDDAFPGTYAYYLQTAAAGRGRMGDERRFEGFSFWQNKALWLKLETSFNVDRVRTPALFATHSESTISYALEIRGAFELNRRPLEYLVYPYGGHLLTRPGQRLACLQATADWMDFWLQGRERTDPAQEGGETKETLEKQYLRWRRMRSEWECQQAWESAGHLVGSVPPLDFMVKHAGRN